MDFMANGPDDGNSRAIQALVIGQGNPAGEPCEVGTVIGVSIMAGMSGSVKTGLGLGVPFSNALIDTTNSHQLSGAAAIRLAAGHSIAFDASGNNYLALDTASSSLRWYQNGLSCPIGKGISVGWQFVVSGNFTLPSYGGGYIVFLVGSGSYTVTLPTAAAMATGVGYTFSALGAATVTITPAPGDSIDNGPVVLRQHDRFHVVSDGVSYWREVFRTNSVSPRFSGPPVLPNYSVANLPSAVTSGAKAFATNGRKRGDRSRSILRRF